MQPYNGSYHQPVPCLRYCHFNAVRCYHTMPFSGKEERKIDGFVVYFSAWCAIRQNDTCTNGARSPFLRRGATARSARGRMQHVVKAVIKAARRITVGRQCETGAEVRPSKLPALRFGAQRYSQLKGWEAEVVTQPPLLSSLSDEELGSSSKLH